MKMNAQVTPKLFTSEAEPPLVGRRQHGTSQTDRCGGTLWRGGSGSTMTRMHRATGEALLIPSRNRRSRNPYDRFKPGSRGRDERVTDGPAVAKKRSNVDRKSKRLNSS